jgi:hypothetical protein
MKNLVIAVVGDQSCHPYWIKGTRNFDLALIYFGDDSNVAEEYNCSAKYFKKAKGNKFKLISEFYKENEKLITENYLNIWMPDDDIIISGDEINRLFEIAHKERLILCQPAMKGYFSHKITRPKFLSYFRNTNFVEVLAPLMEINVFKELEKTFCLNDSGWGFEFLWVKILGNPIDRIGIIDSVKIIHTRPVGNNYSRFSVHPLDELKILNKEHDLNLNLVHFENNFKTHKTVYRFLSHFK